MEPGGHYPPPAEPLPGKNTVVPPVIAIAVGVGVLALGILLVVLLLRLFGGPASPEDVAREFVVAAYEGDGERVCELSAPQMRQAELERFEVSDCAEFGQLIAEDPETQGREAADVEVIEVDEQGDTATVRVSAPTGSPGTWTEVGLERHDDEWFVIDYSG